MIVPEYRPGYTEQRRLGAGKDSRDVQLQDLMAVATAARAPLGQRRSARQVRTRLAVSVVLPCLNESESVGACVKEALSVLARHGVEGEVVVVDNGSQDGSAEIAAVAGARVVHERRRGYGSAIRSGVEAARGDVIVLADADWTYDFGRIPDLVAPVLAGEADLVLGSRFEPGTRPPMPFLHRYLGTPMLTLLVNSIHGLQLTDSQTGFRALRRDVARRLDLRVSGMEFASLMLIKAAEMGLRVVEVPTGYRDRVGESKLNTWQDGWRHLRTICLVAPHVVLVWPGIAAVVIGLLLSGLSLLSSGGIVVGSLKWQPIFFATISLTLGVQAAFVGAVLGHRSSLLTGRRPRFHWIGRRSFPVSVVRAGFALLGAGLLLDGYLFAVWANGAATARGVALASLAQSLLLVGGSLASLGFTARSLLWERSGEDLL